jgi:phage-related protein (TIGR01555 family)
MFNRIALAIKIILQGEPKPPMQPDRQDTHDPLSVMARIKGNDSLEDGEMVLRSAMDDVVKDERERAVGIAMDAAIVHKDYVGDDSTGVPTLKAGVSGMYGVPDGIASWYMSQGFIGWQTCAIMAQQWLINKACEQSGLDAVRHGWDLSVADGTDIDSDVMDEIQRVDTDFNIKNHLSNMAKFTNIFGIRICVFDVDYEDRDATELPFNIDSVRKGSYKGLRQVDPYWCAPLLDTKAATDPTSKRFYKPTWWVIGGKKYHWTHLHVAMGPEVADILKPTIYYGGLSLVQRIYERVYAAERTANEAPLLAMSKRTTALHVDLKKVAADQKGFIERLGLWQNYRDNHAVKVLGLEEKMEESDTSLADFDSLIMSQYQLVAAIAETPSTKLLGTSPKGFNATGEFEEKSYHEKLETIQSDEYHPLLTRHYELMLKSMDLDFRVEIAWNPTDAKTAETQAEINNKKATTGEILINAGVISPDEERKRVRSDKFSGYTGVGEDDAEEAKLAPGTLEHPTPPPSDEGPAMVPDEDEDTGTGQSPNGENEKKLLELAGLVGQLLPILLMKKPSPDPRRITLPTVNPSIQASTVSEVKSAMKGDVAPMNEADMPKVSWNGYRIAIENPAGTYRSGEAVDGTKWSSRMQHDYGYFMGTIGADGEGLDVLTGRVKDAPHVYIVNQIDPATGAFDEHKVFVGFNGMGDAKHAYHAAYGSDWKGFGDIQQLTISGFKDWMGNGDLTKPYTKEWSMGGANVL